MSIQTCADISKVQQNTTITDLLENIKTKNIVIGIVGLGYVGLPLSLVFAEANVQVLGFDIDQDKITSLNNKQSYIKHIKTETLEKAFVTNKFRATNNFEEISECDIVIICVPTPLNHHLEPNLDYIIETTKTLAPHLKPHALVSLESTTWPGTTEEVLRPLIEQESPRRVGHDLYLCFSPEREDPGNSSYQTHTIPKLIGGIDEASLQLGVATYKLAIDKVVQLSDTKVAELAKLFENIFRSVNIALVNELKLICEPMDIDVWEVIRAAATKPFGFMPFWPGPGLGGHCIPIDPFYLTWKAKQYGVSTRFIELAGQINRAMPNYVISKVQDVLNDFGKAVKGSKILILGLAYKPDIDDMRESPSLELMKQLEEKGADVSYHDPYISTIGKTRDYQQLAGKINTPLSPDYDCYILSTQHGCFSKKEILSMGVPTIDTRRFLPKNHELVHQA